MADVNTIKDRIVEKLEGLSTIQKVYPAEKVNPEGWPCAFVRTSDLENEFSSTAENSRVYGFNITVAFPISQDFVPEEEKDRLDYSEFVLNECLDQVISAFDEDMELGNAPVLYTEAIDAEWGYMEFEEGVAQALKFTLKIYTEKVVV